MKTVIVVDRSTAEDWHGDVPVLVPEGTLLSLPNVPACRVIRTSLHLGGVEPIQRLVVR